MTPRWPIKFYTTGSCPASVLMNFELCEWFLSDGRARRLGHASFAHNSYCAGRYHWQHRFRSINQVQLRALAAGETISPTKRREATVNILWRISCNEMHHFLSASALVESLVAKAVLYGNFAAFETKGTFYDVNSEGRTLPGNKLEGFIPSAAI